VRLGYITDAVAQEIEADIKQVSAPLVGLIRSTRMQIGSRILASVCFAVAAVWTVF
jgi:hypothetical protein